MLECVRCGATYGDELDKDWGRTKETSGHGPVPRCVALVDAPHAPLTSSGEVPQEQCNGSFRNVTETAARLDRAVILTPLE